MGFSFDLMLPSPEHRDCLNLRPEQTLTLTLSGESHAGFIPTLTLLHTRQAPLGLERGSGRGAG